ncbi:hypothetical protein BU15DRAFT_53469 [Melanogaster broomeanus]|nr:hypothetical protein BU15DRAFT_53469 [Melanogaster broomeanus]
MPVVPEPPGSSSDPSWEGDRMFNIYIYDYCTKRGFHKTARELLAEAEIPSDSAPPINARQGLLFEWWSVFWVLFTAKSNGAGPDDALVYTQHQLQQSNIRQGMRPSQTMPMNRMMNGAHGPQGLMPTNGHLPNGAGPSSLPGNSGPMQNGAQGPVSFSMPGAGPQANGIPIQSGAPTPAGANTAPPPNFNQLMPGQRQGGPQHRVPNGVNPYQSPPMAHSPQSQGGNGGPNPQHPQAPMSQLGPSPHMAHMARGGMLPPNSNMGSVPPTQTPPFAQLGRSPSRPGTPGQGMLQPSPSLMNRQTPVNIQVQENLNSELNRLPSGLLTSIKQEMGLHEKDLHSLTPEEKTRIVTLSRQRHGNQGVRKPGPSGPQGLAGPSNPVQGMQHPGQRQSGQPQEMQSQQQQQQAQQQQQQQRVVKRNSTSPGEEHGQLPNNESSPPDRKRVRRSSVNMDQPPPIPQYHQPPQQMMNSGMMRPGPGPMPGGPMNFPPHGPPGMGNPGMAMQMGAPQMPGNTMSPAMGGGRANMMQLQYHQGLHAATKGLAMANLPGGGGATPTPGDPSFNHGQGQPSFPGPQNNRVGQNKAMGMMPPPSPAGGPPKEQIKDVNKSGPNGTEGSPRNQQQPNPGQAGAQGNPNSSTQGSTAPPTPSATSSSITAPSPSAVVNGTPTNNPATQPTTLPEVPPAFLSTDFMQSVASTLDDFDPQALFRPEDGGINFEQDFREWFNPDDLEMK